MYQNINQFGFADEVQINIYDPDEPDINKKRIGWAINIDDFCTKHNVSSTSGRRALAKKTRVFSKVFLKEVVIRLGKKEDEKGRNNITNNQVFNSKVS